MPKIPEGFEIETDSSNVSTLPEGFELETPQVKTPSSKLPPGFELESNQPSDNALEDTLNSRKKQLAQEQEAAYAKEAEIAKQQEIQNQPENWSSTRFKKEAPKPQTPEDQAMYDATVAKKQLQEEQMTDSLLPPDLQKDNLEIGPPKPDKNKLMADLGKIALGGVTGAAHFAAQEAGAYKPDPILENAKSQNMYAISQTTGIPLSEVSSEYKALVRRPEITGMRPDTPTFKEFLSIPLTGAVTMGLMSNPIGVALGIAGFMALDEIENKIISTIRKRPYILGAGQGISDLLPEQASEATTAIVDLVDLLGKGLLLGGISKRAPKISEFLTKQMIDKYNLPRDVYIDPVKIRGIFGTPSETGTPITPEELDLVKGLGLDAKGYKEAFSKGITIKVPVEKITTLRDRPYWKALKEAIGLKSTPETKIARPEKVVGKTGKKPLKLSEIPQTAPEGVPGEKPPVMPQEVAKTPIVEAGKQLEVNKTKLLTEKKKNPGAAKNLSTLYEYHAESQGIPKKEIEQTVRHLEGKAEGEEVSKEVSALNNNFVGLRVRTKEGLGLSKGYHKGKLIVRNESGSKLYDTTKVEFIKPVFGLQEAIDSLQMKAETKVRDFLGKKISELEGPPPEVKGEQKQKKSIKLSEIEKSSGTPETPKESVVSKPNIPGEKKTSGLSGGVEAKAVEKKLTDSFKGLSEYSAINMEDQANKASDLLKNDPERARRIAMGQEEAPEGLRNFSVYIALENKALAEGDVSTLRALATQSSLNEESSSAAQALRILAERNEDSPVSAIKQVVKAREEAVKKRGKIKNINAEKKSLAKKIKETIEKEAPGPDEWESFISALEC